MAGAVLIIINILLMLGIEHGGSLYGAQLLHIGNGAHNQSIECPEPEKDHFDDVERVFFESLNPRSSSADVAASLREPPSNQAAGSRNDSSDREASSRGFLEFIKEVVESCPRFGVYAKVRRPIWSWGPP